MQQIIAVGDKVDMEILIRGQLQTDDDKRRVLSCRVMDLPGTNIVRISMPFHEGRIVPLSIGDQYAMNVYAKKGIYGSRYVVVNRLKEGNIFLADMEMQEPLKKVQRREFFRHDCRMPASYRMVPIDEKEHLSPEELECVEWKKGVILDISGGGLRMVSEYQEDTSLLIQVRFSITYEDRIEDVIEYGKLLTSVQCQNSKMLYEQRVEFEQIEDKEREKIIHFIFDEERKKISKEKGL